MSTFNDIKIKYKILEYNEAEQSILVRYYTDFLSEIDLKIDMEDTSIRADGSPSRCRTDYYLNVWPNVTTQEELEKYLLNAAPVQWFRLRYRAMFPEEFTENIFTTIATNLHSVKEKIINIPVPTISVPTLEEYAANVRWTKENAGINVFGIPVYTDDRSKLMILGARIAAEANSQWSTSWDAADGNSYPMDSNTIIYISDRVQEHVNKCFITYTSVMNGIKANTVNTTIQIDTMFSN